MVLPTATASTIRAYSLIQENATVEGFNCYDGSSNNKVTIWRPTDTSKKYPLLSYGHGLRAGGSKVDTNEVIENYASAGFIVVAHQSGESLFCWNTDDQIQSIEWMVQNEPYKSWIDTTKVGIVGYSMGGTATAASAANNSYFS